MISIRPRAALAALLPMLLLCLLTACSSGIEDDARDLLSSVPADAEMAGVADIAKTLQNSSLVKRMGIPGVPADALANPDAEENGIEPTAMVFFTRGSKIYFSGLVADDDKLTATMEKWCGNKFTEEGGVSLCQGPKGAWCAMADGKFWIVDRGTPDADEIRRFTKLTESQSYLKHEAETKQLLKLENNISAILPLSALTAMSGDMMKNAQAMIALQSVFSDPANLLITCDLFPDRADTRIVVADSKCQLSACALRFLDIDAKAVRALDASAPIYFAAGISPATVEKIGKAAGGLIDVAPFTTISGTIVAAFSPNGGLTGTLQTSGPSPRLAEALTTMFDVHTESADNLIAFSSGKLQPGKITAAEAARRFKGAYLGLCVSTDDVQQQKGINISYFTLLMKKYENTVALFLSLEVK